MQCHWMMTSLRQQQAGPRPLQRSSKKRLSKTSPHQTHSPANTSVSASATAWKMRPGFSTCTKASSECFPCLPAPRPCKVGSETTSLLEASITPTKVKVGKADIAVGSRRISSSLTQLCQAWWSCCSRFRRHSETCIRDEGQMGPRMSETEKVFVQRDSLREALCATSLFLVQRQRSRGPSTMESERCPKCFDIAALSMAVTVCLSGVIPWRS